jgi:hypothetical protein
MAQLVEPDAVREYFFGELDNAMACCSGALLHENEGVIGGAVGLHAYQALCLRHFGEEFPVADQRSVSLVARFGGER